MHEQRRAGIHRQMPDVPVDRKVERNDGARIDDLSGCLRRRSTLSRRGDRRERDGRSAKG
jgi:hypothetical protein